MNDYTLIAALGTQALTALSETYTCTNPNCDIDPALHIVDHGCPNENPTVVTCRRAGAVMAQTIAYIKANPSVITP